MTRPKLLAIILLLLISSRAQADDLARYYPTESLIYISSGGLDDLAPVFDRSPAGQVWNMPRFDGIRALIPTLPDVVRKLVSSRTSEASDGEEELADLEQLFLSRSQEIGADLLKSMNHGVAFGIADIIIDPLEPEMISYLIIDAGDDTDKYNSFLGSMMMDLAIEDPRVETLDEVQWAAAGLGTEPPLELWWTTHEGKVIVALGSVSAKTFMAMSRGERTPLTEDEIYSNGMKRCIGDSTVTSSYHIDVPGIVGLVLDTFQEFGGDPPAEADYFIDEISRMGALHYASGYLDGDEVSFTSGSSLPFSGLGGEKISLGQEDLAMVPASPLFLMGLSYDAVGLYQQMQSTLEAFLPEDQMWQIEQGKKTLGALIGVPIDDLVAALGNRLVIFEESTARGIIPGAVMVVSGGNPDLIEKLVVQQFPLLKLAMRSSGASLALKSHGIEFKGEQIAIKYIQMSNSGSRITPAWANINGDLVVALHPTVIEQMCHRLQGDDPDSFQIPPVKQGLVTANDHPPFSYGLVDIGEILEWIWPTLVPEIQRLIDENKLNLEASAIPSAHLFEGWQLEFRYWLDDAGLRQTANGPIPIGNEGWGGLLLAVVMLTAELQESGPVGFEEEDPFAEEPDEAEETETEEKEPL
ncbi:MAG: hypothetical protein VX764_06770 [Planctomycetota bacterium]|nr:hypothetical protein [Planctomycetota bacterium]